MKEIKELQDSKLFIKKIVNIQIDDFGRKVLQCKWEESPKSINLGSLAEPNKEIIGYQYQLPRKKNIFENLFGG